ncbi:ATP-dependent helicase HrpB domain protein [Yersinia pestis PY-36]|nr:ATP-dependent helicase HrpB domain protein [Yersinia pestis PY-36]
MSTGKASKIRASGPLWFCSSPTATSQGDRDSASSCAMAAPMPLASR